MTLSGRLLAWAAARGLDRGRPAIWREPFPIDAIQEGSKQSADPTGSLRTTRTHPSAPAIPKETLMAKVPSTSMTRRSIVAGLAITAVPLGLAGADNANAEDKQATPEKSLYERLGGVFAIAAVVDHFSDAVVKNPIVGQKSKNPQLREWHTKSLERLPGLKFMRTLWVCDVSGGPFKFTATRPGATPLGLEEAHRNLRISPAEFDEVAAELGRSLDHFKVPKHEKTEVLAAFAAHKNEVTAGYLAKRS
jgi:hemoglobin